jgi:hypothetical protein
MRTGFQEQAGYNLTFSGQASTVVPIEEKGVLPMQIKTTVILILGCCLLGLSAASAGDVPATERFPSAFLPETQYTFTSTPEGTELTHDFAVQNRGNAPLIIEKVKTG